MQCEWENLIEPPLKGLRYSGIITGEEDGSSRIDSALRAHALAKRIGMWETNPSISFAHAHNIGIIAPSRKSTFPPLSFGFHPPPLRSPPHRFKRLPPPPTRPRFPHGWYPPRCHISSSFVNSTPFSHEVRNAPACPPR